MERSLASRASSHASSVVRLGASASAHGAALSGPSEGCCGRTAALFLTDGSWRSWRARRALMRASFHSPLVQTADPKWCPVLEPGGAPGGEPGGAPSQPSANPAAVPAATATLGWHFMDALAPRRRMLDWLNASLSRRPPIHGGSAARRAYEEQLAEIRAILTRRDGLEARINACIEYMPPRRKVGASGGRTAAAALTGGSRTGEVAHGQRQGEGKAAAHQQRGASLLMPPLAGWPQHPLFRAQ
jgi:hypothetical protein